MVLVTNKFKSRGLHEKHVVFDVIFSSFPWVQEFSSLCCCLIPSITAASAKSFYMTFLTIKRTSCPIKEDLHHGLVCDWLLSCSMLMISLFPGPQWVQCSVEPDIAFVYVLCVQVDRKCSVPTFLSCLVFVDCVCRTKECAVCPGPSLSCVTFMVHTHD